MMKVFIIILVLSCSFTYSQKQSQIAVLELEGNGISKSDILGLSNRLRSELFRTNKFIVVERSAMETILQEQGFQQTGCTAADCAVEMGQLLNVEKMVSGSIDFVAGIYSINLRMIEVATSKIVLSVTEDCDCDLKTLLTKTMSTVAYRLAGLEAPVQAAAAAAVPAVHPKSVVTLGNNTTWQFIYSLSSGLYDISDDLLMVPVNVAVKFRRHKLAVRYFDLKGENDWGAGQITKRYLKGLTFGYSYDLLTFFGFLTFYPKISYTTLIETNFSNIPLVSFR